MILNGLSNRLVLSLSEDGSPLLSASLEEARAPLLVSAVALLSVLCQALSGNFDEMVEHCPHYLNHPGSPAVPWPHRPRGFGPW